MLLQISSKDDRTEFIETSQPAIIYTVVGDNELVITIHGIGTTRLKDGLAKIAMLDIGITPLLKNNKNRLSYLQEYKKLVDAVSLASHAPHLMGGVLTKYAPDDYPMKYAEMLFLPESINDELNLMYNGTDAWYITDKKGIVLYEQTY